MRYLSPTIASLGVRKVLPKLSSFPMSPIASTTAFKIRGHNHYLNRYMFARAVLVAPHRSGAPWSTPKTAHSLTAFSLLLQPVQPMYSTSTHPSHISACPYVQKKPAPTRVQGRHIAKSYLSYLFRNAHLWWRISAASIKRQLASSIADRYP